MGGKARKSFLIKTRIDRCKGCNICVYFCPKKVLSLEKGKVKVEKPEDCIGCKLCELRCPDFAIVVEEEGGQ